MIRPIAIHLPQFHPFPENDEWWGKGFTEWTNVTKAQPFYEGHYQPQLPSDLGFYDLRLKEARIAQEQLARDYGIYGFCYYHYWFNGKLLMERPLEEKLKNQDEDFPFMICWANENWTRIWDGSENNVLMLQDYNMDDHLAHIDYLIPFFKDERYIRIDGKPVFAVYRTTIIPNIDEVLALWKKRALESGIELYIVRFESFNQRGNNFVTPNLDASVEFQPHTANMYLAEKRNKIILEEKKNFKTLKDEISATTIRNSLKTRIIEPLKTKFKLQQEELEKGVKINYDDLVEADIEYFAKPIHYKLYPCVCPGFDNTPRKAKDYFILEHSTPAKFQNWITKKLQLFKPFSNDENLFFINAWNEWAEGNYLEPSRKWGRQYLEAVKSSFQSIKNQ